jgi:iron(III) transport system substrate-binding protein
MSHSTPGIGGTRRRGFVALLAAGSLALAACGGSPTVTAGAGGGKSDPEADKKLEEVYAQLNGVSDPQARRQRLIALAKDEGGSVTWYTAFNDDDAAALVKDFKAKTGVTVRLYRAGSGTVRQRTEQEASGGGIRADVISATGSDPGILAKEGHYAGLKTPITGRLIPQAVFPTWFGDQVYPFVAAWNSGAYQTAPKDYKDLLTNFAGAGMAIEQTDADWLYGMVELLKKQDGMTEEAALKLVGDAVRKSTPFDGHTSMTELIAAGQFKISPDNYHYRVLKTIKDGGKLAWNPKIGPIISEFGGTGIAKGAAHPAAALLLAEYLMIDNQEIQWVASQRTSTLKGARIGVAATPDAEIFYIDYNGLIANITRYQKLFGDMLAATGKTARS